MMAVERGSWHARDFFLGGKGNLLVTKRAAYPVFRGNWSVSFEERDVPRPGPGQILLEVKANAICGSDVGAFRGGSSLVPGHEAAARVAEAGEGATHAPGTLGIVFLMDFCGQCRSCLTGATNQCRAKRADYGFSHDGGYGPMMLVNENVFFPIDDDIDPAEASMMLDIMGTGGHAIARARALHDDVRSMLVTGAGPIGLGIDVAIDASGASPAVAGALATLAPRGVLVCVGHGARLDLDLSADVSHPERAIVGSEYFRFDELAPNLVRFREHRAYLSRIITHRFDIKDIEQAFATFLSGKSGKVVVTQ